eukprot:Sspe_Gene.16073::Locus_5652_Transcript_1_1_Confidence_1.000_Length_1255::g.16073::m.16073
MLWFLIEALEKVLGSHFKQPMFSEHPQHAGCPHTPCNILGTQCCSRAYLLGSPVDAPVQLRAELSYPVLAPPSSMQMLVQLPQSRQDGKLEQVPVKHGGAEWGGEEEGHTHRLAAQGIRRALPWKTDQAMH